jgi:NhaP-type Na+/H+ or K+/H+ antiporter/uncharacterized protein YaaQ
MSASTKILVFNFWEIAAFLANSFVFLLIGLQIDLRILFENWPVILVAIIAVLAARAVGVYTFSNLGHGVPKQYKPVLFWGGLRGAISLALAISLPASIEMRSDIQSMAFGVVLFTLLVQGLTMQPLIRRMKLIQQSEKQQEYERRHARAVMSKAAYERLENMQASGFLSGHVWESISPILKDHTEKTAQAVRNILHEDPEVEFDEYKTAQREALMTQRSTLSGLVRDGIISEETFSKIAAEIDIALTESPVNWLESTHQNETTSISGLIAAVIQEQDLENVVENLSKLDIPIVRMSSAGEFLGRRNTTILIGVPENQEGNIIQALQKSSKMRVEILSDTEENQEITIGATLFSFDVERYEEL